MARDLSCPVCSAELMFTGDERAGDEVFCTYCGAPCRLSGKPGDEDCDVEVEDDF